MDTHRADGTPVGLCFLCYNFFMFLFPPAHHLEIVQGDITTQPLDAIVNAANVHLVHGGGVARAIAHKAGKALWDESRAWVAKHGALTHDRPAITTGGNLPCRYVIHAVGPVWHGGHQGEDRALAAAISGALRCAAEHNLTSVALPAISTGIFGYPVERAAGVILQSIADYFQAQPDSPLQLVRMVLYDRPTLEIFLRIAKNLWPET